MNNKAMYNLSYGLFVLTARENEKDNGCIVNTVAQVTTSPNRILVAVNKNNYTHGMILRTGEFNVSILTERAAFNTFKHWGFQSGSDVDKLSALPFGVQTISLFISLKKPMPISAPKSSPPRISEHIPYSLPM